MRAIVTVIGKDHVGIIADVTALLAQYGVSGSIYAEAVLGIGSPRVAVLNIGEEETKGNAQTKATYELLKEDGRINFVGNLEGSYIFTGQVADVIVCDGFVGNTVLKMAEGLYRINKKLDLDIDPAIRTLTREDIIAIIKYLIQLINSKADVDDIDHFGNRRIRQVGELIQNQLRTGLSRMERVVRERMTTQDPEAITPQSLINIRPVNATIKEFFGTSQLSQFMDQNNPLAGVTNKRRLSALGPGGLSRDRASMEVRDVHPSHFGRMCPIESPEGPNIGLIGSLATFGRIHPFGFIETPYRNTQMLASLLEALSPATRLTVATDITGSAESIRTLEVKAWRALPEEARTLPKLPTVFALLAQAAAAPRYAPQHAKRKGERRPEKTAKRGTLKTKSGAAKRANGRKS